MEELEWIDLDIGIGGVLQNGRGKSPRTRRACMKRFMNVDAAKEVFAPYKMENCGRCMSRPPVRYRRQFMYVSSLPIIPCLHSGQVGREVEREVDITRVPIGHDTSAATLSLPLALFGAPSIVGFLCGSQ